jgi:molybdopterin synthase sulfur carrier subunit
VSVVRIPPVLRPTAGGAKQLEVDGATVAEILETLAVAHPALRSQLFTPDGQLNRFVNVYVDGQDVRYLDGPATPVGPDDELVILPARAGGSVAWSR